MSGNKRLPRCFFVLFLLLAWLFTAPLIAGERRSLEQVVAQVKKQTGGRILSAETHKNHGQRMYRIKVLLPDGRIRVVRVKAEQGR